MIAVASVGDIDPLGWAKFPRSSVALEYVIQASKDGDERLTEILASHIRDGVCDEQGKLLRVWSGGQWVRPAWYARANYERAA